MATRISNIDDTLSKLQKTITEIKDSSHSGIFIWRIDKYSRRKRDAVNGENISVYSAPFYVGRYGYKMRARVYLNGDGKGKGTHLSFFITIVRGDYDNILKWPFTQKTSLMMLDQSGNEAHVMDSFMPIGMTDSFKKPVTSMNLSSGTPLFASQKIIESPNSVYKLDDTIYLKISVDTTGMQGYS